MNTGPVPTPAIVVTVTAPVLPVAGAVTTSEVVVADVTVVAVPLNLTRLLAATGSKFVPVSVTVAPARPEAGLMAVTVGACK